jgi:PhnB protein
MQRVIPMMAYEDAAAAMDWLVQAFGFTERDRFTENGVVGHGELELDGGTVYLAQPTPDYEGPRRHAETCEAARRWQEVPWVIDGVFVQVNDVDAHYERAKAAGATILSEPEDSDHGRFYRAEDLEGHRWMFEQA